MWELIYCHSEDMVGPKSLLWALTQGACEAAAAGPVLFQHEPKDME
jgi:hypothetical protein